MRSFWLLLLIVALTWGLWSFFRTEEEWSPDPLPTAPAPKESPADPIAGRAIQTTGVVSITVRTREGAAPEGTEAGYRWGDGERLKPIDQQGTVRFTDAPLGDLIVVAHADGYVTGTRRQFLSAGVPTDVVIVLEPRDVSLDDR
jgi:hypothetical protein